MGNWWAVPLKNMKIYTDDRYAYFLWWCMKIMKDSCVGSDNNSWLSQMYNH